MCHRGLDLGPQGGQPISSRIATLKGRDHSNRYRGGAKERGTRAAAAKFRKGWTPSREGSRESSPNASPLRGASPSDARSGWLLGKR